MAADTAHPVAEKPFHLVIDMHVAQRVSSLGGVVLPMFGPLEILGDERQLLSGSGGTEYRETISVLPHQSGTLTIAPAYLDALDARDGKPKRFLSNALTLQVGSAAGLTLIAAASPDLRAAAEVAAGILIVLLLAWGVLRFRRPSHIVTAPPEPSPAPVVPDVPSQPEEDPYDRALTDLREDPTRARALRVRERIWEHVGASQFDTLADVLRRPATHDVAVRNVLRALERAAFTHDADVPSAMHDAIAMLERITAS